MQTLLAPHAQLLNNPSRDLDWIRRWQPTWVKYFQPDGNKVRQLLDMVPKVILRKHEWSEEFDWLARDPAGLGRDHAKRWRQLLYDDWDLHLEQVSRLVVEGLNEPPDTNPEEAARLNTYLVAASEACIQDGMYFGGPNSSTGHVYDSGPGTPPNYEPYREFVEHQKRIGGPWLTHEYCDVRGPDSDDWLWNMGRILQRPDWMRGMPILVTECGYDQAVNAPLGTPHHGWNGHLSAEDYATNYLGRYDYKMAQDPDIEALCVFVYDTNDPGSWGTFDIANEQVMTPLFAHFDWMRQQDEPDQPNIPDPPDEPDQPDPPSNGNGGTMPDPTVDPRAENCRAFRMENNKVVGIELVHEPKPDTTFFLKRVRLIDENEAKGQTVANVTVLDKDGIPAFGPVVLGYPYPPGLEKGLYPGNANRPAQHVVSNKFDPNVKVGPLCIYIGAVGEPDSAIIGGIGLPHGHHVSFEMVYQMRSDDPVDPEPDGTFKEKLQIVAQAEQKVRFNPDAALQKRMFADGFIPNSNEFELDGRVCQRGEKLDENLVRAYYVVKGDWNNVNFIEYRT